MAWDGKNVITLIYSILDSTRVFFCGENEKMTYHTSIIKNLGKGFVGVHRICTEKKSSCVFCKNVHKKYFLSLKMISNAQEIAVYWCQSHLPGYNEILLLHFERKVVRLLSTGCTLMASQSQESVRKFWIVGLEMNMMGTTCKCTYLDFPGIIFQVAKNHVKVD